MATTPTGAFIDPADNKFDWTNFLIVEDPNSSDPVLGMDTLEAIKTGIFNRVPLIIGQYVL